MPGSKPPTGPRPGYPQPVAPMSDSANAPADVAFLQSIIESAQEMHTFTFTYQGKSFQLTYRNLGWIDQNYCLSAARQFLQQQNPVTNQTEAVGVFRMDTYKKLALKKMIVQFPLRLTDTVLDNLPPEVGVQLDTIIPDPEGVIGDVEAVKKE